MTTFKFNKYGNELGTRMLGAQVREELIPIINALPKGDKLILDFADVKVVANSFADECIAKLLYEMTLDDLKQCTTFKNVNDFVRQTIAIAIKRRQSFIEHPEEWPSFVRPNCAI